MMRSLPETFNAGIGTLMSKLQIEKLNPTFIAKVFRKLYLTEQS